MINIKSHFQQKPIVVNMLLKRGFFNPSKEFLEYYTCFQSMSDWVPCWRVPDINWFSHWMIILPVLWSQILEILAEQVPAPGQWSIYQNTQNMVNTLLSLYQWRSSGTRPGLFNQKMEHMASSYVAIRYLSCRFWRLEMKKNDTWLFNKEDANYRLIHSSHFHTSNSFLSRDYFNI